MNATPLRLFSQQPISSEFFKIQGGNSLQQKNSFLANKPDDRPTKQIYQTFSRINETETRNQELQAYKQELEKHYQDRINQMSEMTQYRIDTLWAQVQNALKSILEDELIDTMKQDPTSKEFVWHRVVELFEELFSGEREKLIEKLSEQYSILKADFSQMQRVNQSLEQKLQQMESAAQNHVYVKEMEQSRTESEHLKQQQAERVSSQIQERTQKFKELNTELQMKLEHSQQQCLFLQQAADQFKLSVTDLTDRLYQKDQHIQQIQFKFQDYFVYLKSKLESKVSDTEENMLKRINIYKNKLEDMKYLVNRLKQKQSNFKFQLKAKLQQKKTEIAVQYDDQFRKHTKEIEKLSQKNQKLKDQIDQRDKKAENIEQQMQDVGKQIIQKNAEIQQLSFEKQQLSLKLEEVTAQQNNDQIQTHQKQEKEFNKFIQQLQEKETQITQLSQINREIELMYQDKVSILNQQLSQSLEENQYLSLDVQETQANLQLKEAELLKNQNIQQKLQDYMKREEEQHQQLVSLRRQLDENQVLIEQLKERGHMSENQYTSQIEQSSRMAREREVHLRQQLDQSQDELKKLETQVLLFKKQVKTANTKSEDASRELQNLKQSYEQIEKDNQYKKDLLNQSEHTLSQLKRQLSTHEEQMQEFQNLIYQQQAIIEQQKNDYEGQYQSEIDDLIKSTKAQQDELIELRKYCKGLDDENQQLQQQMYAQRNQAQNALDQRDKVTQRCKDKMKRVAFILTEQRNQCFFQLSKMKREVQSLRQFVVGCLQSEKSSMKLIFGAFEAQYQGLWGQVQLGFQNQQMQLRNQLQEKFDTHMQNFKDQNKQKINELNRQSETKIKQLTQKNEEQTSEIQQLVNIVERTEAQLQDLQDELRNIMNQRNQMEATLKDKQNEYLGAQHEIELLNQVNKKQEGNLKSQEKEKQNLKLEITGLQKQLQSLKESKDIAVQNLKQQLEVLTESQHEEVENITHQHQEEINQIKKLLQDKSRLAESLSVRLQEAEKVIIDLEQEVDGFTTSFKIKKPQIDADMRLKDQQIEKLNQIIMQQSEEISKVDKENLHVKQMLQRMSESFEQRTSETTKENQDLLRVQHHLQEEIKGLYKYNFQSMPRVLTNSNTSSKDNFLRRPEPLPTPHQHTQITYEIRPPPQQAQSSNLESKLRQLKELNSMLDEKSKKKYPSQSTIKYGQPSPNQSQAIKYMPRPQTQQSPGRQKNYI